MSDLLYQVIAKVKSLVLRGQVDSVDDSQKTQAVKATFLADDIRSKLERFTHYGFFSVPRKGAELIGLAIGADQSHVVIVADDDSRERPANVAEGDVGLYNKNGVMVRLSDDGILHLGANEAANFVALANLVKAELDGVKSALDSIKQHNNTHTHPTGVGPSGPAVPPLVLTWSPGEVAAEKVRAK
jgi:phage baseplate assembly protein V